MVPTHLIPLFYLITSILSTPSIPSFLSISSNPFILVACKQAPNPNPLDTSTRKKWLLSEILLLVVGVLFFLFLLCLTFSYRRYFYMLFYFLIHSQQPFVSYKQVQIIISSSICDIYFLRFFLLHLFYPLLYTVSILFYSIDYPLPSTLLSEFNSGMKRNSRPVLKKIN